jgi:hypothetical protein
MDTLFQFAAETKEQAIAFAILQHSALLSLFALSLVASSTAVYLAIKKLQESTEFVLLCTAPFVIISAIGVAASACNLATAICAPNLYFLYLIKELVN